jgi:hypothetical protein
MAGHHREKGVLDALEENQTQIEVPVESAPLEPEVPTGE